MSAPPAHIVSGSLLGSCQAVVFSSPSDYLKLSNLLPLISLLNVPELSRALLFAVCLSLIDPAEVSGHRLNWKDRPVTERWLLR